MILFDAEIADIEFFIKREHKEWVSVIFARFFMSRSGSQETNWFFSAI